MYDHDIALDWAQSVMAVARMTAKGKRLQEFEAKSNISDLKAFLKSLKGTKRFNQHSCQGWPSITSSLLENKSIPMPIPSKKI
jgi:hypothetical protein